MNAITYGPAGESRQAHEDELGGELPGRPRRKLLNPWSAALFAVIAGAVGFLIGVRVEKGQLAGSSNGAAAGLAARFAGATSGGSPSGRSTSASRTGSRFGGFGGFAGAGGGGGGTVGTVASVNGRTIYVTETSGNTVKVRLSGATKITKAQDVGRSKIDPGDTVVIAGVTAAKGMVSATSLTDSGSRASSSSSTSSSTSASGNSGSSVSSLFGG